MGVADTSSPRAGTWSDPNGLTRPPLPGTVAFHPILYIRLRKPRRTNILAASGAHASFIGERVLPANRGLSASGGPPMPRSDRRPAAGAASGDAGPDASANGSCQLATATTTLDCLWTTCAWSRVAPKTNGSDRGEGKWTHLSLIHLRSHSVKATLHVFKYQLPKTSIRAKTGLNSGSQSDTETMANLSNENIAEVVTVDEPSFAMVEKATAIDLKNADLALQILYDIDVSPEDIAAVDEKAFLRKVDLRMLPIVSCPFLSSNTLPPLWRVSVSNAMYIDVHRSDALFFRQEHAQLLLRHGHTRRRAPLLWRVRMARQHLQPRLPRVQPALRHYYSKSAPVQVDRRHDEHLGRHPRPHGCWSQLWPALCHSPASGV